LKRASLEDCKNKTERLIGDTEKELDKLRKEKFELSKQIELKTSVYQRELEFKDELIDKLKAPEEEERKTEKLSNWKVYGDKSLGIEFRYPNKWIESDGKLIDGVKQFKALPLTDRGIQVDILRDSEGGDLEKISQDILGKNGGSECGHEMESGTSGEMFMTTCGGGSEKYNYIFQNKKSVIIRMKYGDDFEDYWSEDVKVERLRKIISTIRVF